MNRTTTTSAALRTAGRIVLCLLMPAGSLPSGGASAAILEQRPGPIELPHHVVAADLDRDGYQDLVVANFQAGTLDLLINQKNGTYAPHERSPVEVGVASFNTPSSGPLIVLVGELNRDDADSDTIANPFDNCPNVQNFSQALTAEGLDGFCGARGPDNICDTSDDDPSLFGPDTICGTVDDLPGSDDNTALFGNDGICGTADDVTDASGPGNACRLLDATGSPLDSDGDGVLDFDPAMDSLDNCPLMPNPLQEDAETAEGPDSVCGTADDHPLHYGPDGICGTADDLPVGDGVGDVCQLSPDLVILENSVGLGSPLGIVRVRVNDGSGGMNSRQSLLTGLQPASAVLEDFDGDRMPDLVVSSGDSDALQLFPGGADANFQPQIILDARTNPQGLAAGDFDGDGDADLAVAQSCDHSVGVYRNDGGTLAATQTAHVSTDLPSPLLIQPSLLVAGSFNDDALDDLAVLGSEGNMTCTGGSADRLGQCCLKPADCEDPSDPVDNGTGVCTASGSDQGIVQVFLGTFRCSGGPNDGNTCSDDSDCADTPPDPTTDGTCVTLAPNPAATILLAAGERATGGVLQDFDADGQCLGMESGSCDSGTGNCANPAASGEPCTLDADCARSLCSAGPYIGRVCAGTIECSAGDLALAIGRAEGGNGRASIYPGLGDGSFSSTPTNLTGFVQPRSPAPIDLDPAVGAQPDLAVLDRDLQRTILFDNDDVGGGLSFTLAPESPASAWKLSKAMELMALDVSVGIDLLLVQESPPRLDNLSGLGNGFFRSLPSLPIEGTINGLPGLARVTGLLTSDLRDNARLDLVLLDTSDPSNGYLTVVLNTVFGVPEESETLMVPGGLAFAAAGSLATEISDYDRDGIPNLLDNCPTRYNPADCEVTNPSCRIDIVCDDPAFSPTDCMSKDPTTAQCDSDGNGIGDHCQILDELCASVDSDLDFIADYNPFALAETPSGEPDYDRDGVANSADNCPTTANSDQADDNRAEGPDGTCNTADDNVFLYGPDNLCGTMDDLIGNFIGDACEIPLELALGQCNAMGMCDEPAGVSCVDDSDCVTGECTGASDADLDGVCDYDPRVLPQPDQASAVAAALDNCIALSNPRRCSDDLTVLCDDDLDCGPGASCAQPDTNNDHVGNACIGIALDNCPFRINTNQNDADQDGVGDLCAVPANDVLTVDNNGTLANFTGDGSGRLFPPLMDPFAGLSLSTPSSALIGNLSLRCTDVFKLICFTASTTDVLVAEAGVVGDPNDDRLTLLRGDGAGSFATGSCDTSGLCDTGSGTCLMPGSAIDDSCSVDADCDRCDASNPDSEGLACATDVDCRRPLPAPTQGDPEGLQIAINQPVCSWPQDPALPQLRFDSDAASNIVVVSQPGTSTLGVFLPSNLSQAKICISGPLVGLPCIDSAGCSVPGNPGVCGAGNLPSLAPPPAYPTPLLMPDPLTAVSLADMNGDGTTDIVALSSGDGDPMTPNLMVYFGLGNGLYFTDPSLNPTDVQDGSTLLATANINLETDVFLPEVALFYPPEDVDGNGILDPGEDLNGNGVLDGDRGPIVLTNILNERADIDGSGRIDGFDMAVLSRAFGASRGEDFSLVEINGQVQLAQTGMGKCAGGPNDGQDCTGGLDCPGGSCGQLFRRVLDNSSPSFVGKDLPDSEGICNLTQDRMTAGRCDTTAGVCTLPGSKAGLVCSTDQDCGGVLYSLAVDINLDGLVDGLDLAILASLFGRTL